MDESRMTAYDGVSYPSFPIYSSHPDRLATIASLFGMKPAPPENCKVLEIGCFDGANLAAMAMGLPQSQFVGVDVARNAIDRGCALAREVGLNNLCLRHLDLMDMASDDGKFDYIIVHGVYSWVPEPARERILAICKASLAPQGIAFVSYNTFPGCHNRLMLREMMLFHNRDFNDPEQRMRQALNLLKVLANSLEKKTEPYAMFLQDELERLSGRPLEALYHDELAETFAPFYFHEFMQQAHRYRLQFLGEADFFDMVPRGLTPKAIEVLDKIHDDIILKEQYLDFMRGRHFRKTLLCHREVTLERNPKSNSVRSYYVSTFAQAASPASKTDPATQETFAVNLGAQLSTADPLARALFWCLLDNDPERLAFRRLANEAELLARRKFGFVPQPGQDAAADLAEVVWVGYRVGLLELHSYVPPFVTRVSARPVASPLARWQARRSDVVSTLHHRTLKLGSPVHRGILAVLDGSRDRSALRADVLQVFESGTLDLLDGDGRPIRNMKIVGKTIDEELEPFLQKLAQRAVLMG